MSERPEESELPERLVGLSTVAGRAGLAAQELQRVGGQERRVLGNQAELRDVEAGLGLGRTAALHHRSPTLSQIR